jgi:hypothetical protein
VFQVAIQSLMSFSRAWTEVCTPRRISLSVSRPNHRSINRPWGAGSSAGACSGVSGEPVEVFLDAGYDACVPGDFGVPAAFGGVVAERGGIGELGLEGWGELGSGDEVVALLADVGVWACFGG